MLPQATGSPSTAPMYKRVSGGHCGHLRPVDKFKVPDCCGAQRTYNRMQSIQGAEQRKCTTNECREGQPSSTAFLKAQVT